MGAVRRGIREWVAMAKAPFFAKLGLGSVNPNHIDLSFDNDYKQKWSAADDSHDIEGVSVDSDNVLRIGQQATAPQVQALTFNIGANASIGQNNTFFIADRKYYVQGISYVHKTACSTAGAVTANVTHDTSTGTPGSGTSVMSNTFNAKGTANTVQTATLNGTVNQLNDAVLVLNAGDRLALHFSNATLTSLAGVVVTVYVTPGCKSEIVQYSMHANGDLSSQTIFVANRDILVSSVRAVYGTAFAGGVTIDVTQETTTGAPGSGTSVLNAAMAGDGAINTVLTPAMATGPIRLLAGDRLSVKYSATTTGADVCICVVLQPLYNRKEVTWQLGPTGQQQVAQNFFIADRDYEVADLSCTYATQASGAAKLAVEICKGTTAPGSGTVVQTDNTNAGFDLNTTVNTVQVGTLATLRNRMLLTGDRLSLKPTGAAQSVANVAITVSLIPR